MNRRFVSVLSALVLAAGIFFITPPEPAYACSCADVSLDYRYETSDVIFSGTARSKDDSGGNTFEVDRVWKGSGPEDGYVYSGFFGMCGTEFELGESYLVYTNNVKGVEHTGLCSGNLRLAEAGEAIAMLNAMAEPEQVRGSSAWLAAGAAAAVLLASAILLYRIRNRRNSR